jgi:outer membrane protein assembly factor BamB
MMRTLKKLIFSGAFLMLLPGTISLFAQPQPGTLLWSYGAPYPITTCPAIGSDGTVYFGTDSALYAITNAGSNKWTFPIGVARSPMIGTDNTIYFGVGSTFYAVNPNGSIKWTNQLQSGFQYEIIYQSSPALGADESIYFVASGLLFALNSEGFKKWTFPVDNASTPLESFSPAIASDGTIYVGSYYNRKVFALNPDGTEKWAFSLPSAAGDSPAIGADGTLYITGTGLYALTAEGTNVWFTQTNSFFQASPALGRDGTIYVSSSQDLSLYAISPTGQIKWHAVRYGPNTNAVSTPAIDTSGTIYYCVSNSVFALDPEGNVQWAFVSADSPGTPPSGISPAIGPNGTVYACFGSHLYAIAGTNALGNTPWPMYRQNLRHTGKLEKPLLTQLTKRPDAGFEFEMFGEVGQPYTIQRSTNLASWAVLTNFVAGTQTTSVVDFTASNSPSRFYRALIQ